MFSRTPLIRKLIIRIINYPERFVSSGKFIENCKKNIFPEITGYQIKYNAVLRLIELQIRRGRNVWTQVRTVNSDNRRGSKISHSQIPFRW